MQKMYGPITPQKRTLAFHHEDALKELSPSPCPCPKALLSHRKHPKLELLQSPAPLHRDLFSQLLSAELEDSFPASPVAYEIMEEEYYE
jgi:hypothetical protein